MLKPLSLTCWESHVESAKPIKEQYIRIRDDLLDLVNIVEDPKTKSESESLSIYELENFELLLDDLEYVVVGISDMKSIVEVFQEREAISFGDQEPILHPVSASSMEGKLLNGKEAHLQGVIEGRFRKDNAMNIYWLVMTGYVLIKGRLISSLPEKLTIGYIFVFKFNLPEIIIVHIKEISQKKESRSTCQPLFIQTAANRLPSPPGQRQSSNQLHTLFALCDRPYFASSPTTAVEAFSNQLLVACLEKDLYHNFNYKVVMYNKDFYAAAKIRFVLRRSIPYEIGNSFALQFLSLDSSILTGCYGLLIFNNGIQGQIPEIGNLSDLIELDIGGNELIGRIRDTLGQLRKLQMLILSVNKLQANNLFIGSLAPKIDSIKSIRELYLSGNRFPGDIPSTIGQLQNLENQTLSNNQLHDPIPELFGNLISLKLLDLSKNKLDGVFPKLMEKLEYLEYFNVSFNELTGEIPNEGPFRNFTLDFFVGNRELCGASQFKVKPCKDNTTRISNKTRVLKYILPSISIVIILPITVIYLMRCYSKETLLLVLTTSPITIKRISYYEVLDATKKFGEENLIGKGSVGSVYKGVFSDGMISAIKVFTLDLDKANNNFDSECQILCNTHHRNLVKVISSCTNLDLKALVLEYMPNGNLTKWLSSSNYFLNLAQRLEIMIDVASALEYLHYGHPSPIVHCDLKPSNILLDEDMVAHVADFGIAKLLTKDQRVSITKTLGNIGYMAPEYGSSGLVSTATHVYSYGIMLMETFTKKKPTDDMFGGEFTMRKWVLESFPDAIL
ncbi:probable LRR receptor-like serine/threonine-protein kinase At3g47570 [Olea europaea var. sylvestris]|uniref:probable LRR receptor-like serine/threonine-protein kinase At3g47570 n=1 Tax=Olea europaea var. sylvestris TaxID=158386 RepID=UPI000C1CF9CB|nr:probable LRR receptor-like serine/threonine-protein kinase At3g47570 [Olea europaea var. sylvestris]